MDHSGAKFLSGCGPVKPTKRVICSENTMMGEAQDRCTHSKREKWEGAKGHRSQANPNLSRVKSIRFQGVRTDPVKTEYNVYL